MTGAWNPDFFDLVDAFEQAGVEYVEKSAKSQS
jgi:hypothetical protein